MITKYVGRVYIFPKEGSWWLFSQVYRNMMKQDGDYKLEPVCDIRDEVNKLVFKQ